MDDTQDILQRWQWEPQPRAGAFLREGVDAIQKGVPFAERMSALLLDEAGIRLWDMVDLLRLPPEKVHEAESRGWHSTGKIEDGCAIYENPSGQFPRIGLSDRTALYMKVESAEDFLTAHELRVPIVGEPQSGRRVADLEHTPVAAFGVIERHNGIANAASDPRSVVQVLENFRNRNRDTFAHASELIDEAVGLLGASHAAHMFFRAEREYWQSRNHAAQVQKRRQDRLGIGWANHDHHTYRSSRENFAPLIAIFEKLDFHCRERFYAGRAAGWGAQVLENSDAGLVLFCDVDLSPDELRDDFAHEGLSPRAELGTIGLWCGLHGDSFLQAGMHHLEGTFSFDRLRDQLAQEQVRSMKPFTDFPHLRQAFTEGERWRVDAQRVQALLDAGRITGEQAETFLREGAVGSHLENLERNDGFKGFNQSGVSEIIAATDPRKLSSSMSGM